jgi:hypothetical protein
VIYVILAIVSVAGMVLTIALTELGWLSVLQGRRYRDYLVWLARTRDARRATEQALYGRTLTLSEVATVDADADADERWTITTDQDSAAHDTRTRAAFRAHWQALHGECTPNEIVILPPDAAVADEHARHREALRQANAVEDETECPEMGQKTPVKEAENGSIEAQNTATPSWINGWGFSPYGEPHPYLPGHDQFIAGDTTRFTDTPYGTLDPP